MHDQLFIDDNILDDILRAVTN